MDVAIEFFLYDYPPGKIKAWIELGEVLRQHPGVCKTQS